MHISYENDICLDICTRNMFLSQRWMSGRQLNVLKHCSELLESGQKVPIDTHLCQWLIHDSEKCNSQLNYSQMNYVIEYYFKLTVELTFSSVCVSPLTTLMSHNAWPLSLAFSSVSKCESANSLLHVLISIHWWVIFVQRRVWDVMQWATHKFWYRKIFCQKKWKTINNDWGRFRVASLLK
jgi:hypothetical protein